MKFVSTLVKWLTAAAATALLGACAVVPAGGGHAGYGYGQPQGQVYVSPAPVYVGPPAVVVRPAPFYIGGGWGVGGAGRHGRRH